MYLDNNDLRASVARRRPPAVLMPQLLRPLQRLNQPYVARRQHGQRHEHGDERVEQPVPEREPPAANQRGALLKLVETAAALSFSISPPGCYRAGPAGYPVAQEVGNVDENTGEEDPD